MHTCRQTLLGAVVVLSAICAAQAQPTAPTARFDLPTRHTGLRQTAHTLLCAKVADLRCQRTPLRIAFERLSAASDANIMVLWDVLADAGVDPETPISLRAHHVPLETALWLILDQVRAPNVEFAYQASPELIVVATHEYFDRQTILRIYDVGELIAGRTRLPTFAIEQHRQYVESIEPVVGSGAAMARPIVRGFRSGTLVWTYGDEDNDFSAAGRQRRMQALIDLIVTSIEPESWVLNGGRGLIVPWGNLLIVRAAPSVHRQLGGPFELNELRD